MGIWPCGQNPGRGPKPADALHARETMEPRRTGFDLQGQALCSAQPTTPARRWHDCSISEGERQPSSHVGQPAVDST
jgi:hypothetical protein